MTTWRNQNNCFKNVFLLGFCIVLFSCNGKQQKYVDLGLPSGTLWATCNIGASSPEMYGEYFAWAETTRKEDYSWETYKYSKGSYETLTKYNSDNKTILDLTDDVAHVTWGGNWHVPTDKEWAELRTICTWIWTTQKGINGYKVFGLNKKSIFLPAAGCRKGLSLDNVGTEGYYSSSVNLEDMPDLVSGVHFSSSSVKPSAFWRSIGQCVRPAYQP